MTSRAVPWLFIASLSSLPSTAEPRASSQACLTAYERTQSARRDSNLLDAREAAIACSSESCPAALSADCVRWAGELQALVPGLVFDVRLPDGSNATDVTVLLDGATLTTKLDGKAISVNPGPHAVVLRAPGYPDVTTKIVALEGDRTRKVSAVLTKPGAKAGGDAPAGATHRPVPLITWVAGGTAVATLLTASIFAGVGLSQRAALEACKPGCTVDAAASAARLLALADGFFIGTALIAGLTAVSWFTRPEVPVWVGFVPGAQPAVAFGGTWP